MHLYLRLLVEAPVELDPARSKLRLHGILLAAPGIERIKQIEPHRKGGHAVTLDVDQARLDELMAHLTELRLMSVF